MQTNYGYDPYKGKDGNRRGRKIILGILFVLLALAVAAFFYIRANIYYTDDGKAHIELPFSMNVSAQNEGEETDPVPPTREVTVVREPESAPPVPSQTLPPFLKDAVSAEVSARSLADGSALTAMREKGAQVLVVDFKPISGKLSYKSASETAVTYALFDRDAPTQDEIAESIQENNLTVSALVSCFRDNALPRQNHSYSLRTDSGNFMDGDGNRWTSLLSENVTDYLTDICREIAKMGVRQITLTDTGYPTSGAVDRILPGENFDPEKEKEARRVFLDKVETALSDYPDVTLVCES